MEGGWVSVVTGSPPPAWLQWRPGARTDPDWDCATMRGGWAEQCLCYEKKTAVCEMRNNPSQLLRLTGLCRHNSPPLTPVSVFLYNYVLFHQVPQTYELFSIFSS